jgi:hypothetical protein
MIWITYVLLLIERVCCFDAGRTLKRLFVGSFDNTEQAALALAAGKPTARQGGHEKVTVHVEDYGVDEENMVLAKYFLDDDISKTFRYRVYKFLEPEAEESIYCAYMALYRPLSTTLKRLRQVSYNSNIYVPSMEELEYIPACDIGWKWLSSKYDSVGGELLGDGILTSEIDPSRKIKVEDSLQLSTSGLQINDSVYDLESGEQLIGNINGTPYILKRRMS